MNSWSSVQGKNPTQISNIQRTTHPDILVTKEVNEIATFEKTLHTKDLIHVAKYIMNDMPVAVKTYKTGTRKSVEKRADHEIEMLLKMKDSPYIPELIKVQKSSKSVSIVMEYVPYKFKDRFLELLWKDTIEDFAKCVRILKGVYKGIYDIHMQGLAHNDLHFGNIGVTANMEARIYDIESLHESKATHQASDVSEFTSYVLRLVTPFIGVKASKLLPTTHKYLRDIHLESMYQVTHDYQPSKLAAMLDLWSIFERGLRSKATEDPEKNVYLTIEFDQKEEAKRLGAKWDRQRSLWYYPVNAKHNGIMDKNLAVLREMSEKNRSEAVELIFLDHVSEEDEGYVEEMGGIQKRSGSRTRWAIEHTNPELDALISQFGVYDPKNLYHLYQQA